MVTGHHGCVEERRMGIGLGCSARMGALSRDKPPIQNQLCLCPELPQYLSTYRTNQPLCPIDLRAACRVIKEITNKQTTN